MAEQKSSHKFTKTLKVGDHVTRVLGGLPMKMKVVEIKDGLIVCNAIQDDGKEFPGGWTFDAKTGVEEDADLGWGVKFGVTGSYLIDD